MKAYSVKIQELRPLLPLPALGEGVPLYESIKECGLMQPLIINGLTLCDGHKRLAALKSLGAKECLCVETELSPAYAFIKANGRELSAYELAALFAGSLNEKELKAFWGLNGISRSPQLERSLAYIAKHILSDNKLASYSMPLSVWRELGHLGERMGDFAADLLLLNASAAEKRNIAALLRQTARKNSLPPRLEGKTGQEAIAFLNKLAEPRRQSALDKYEKALKQSVLPPATRLKIDATFAKPGIQAVIDVKRSDLSVLNSLKSALEAIFKAVPEL